MAERDIIALAMHGEMDQIQRSQVLKDFRNATSKILVTTDLLARGIDVQHVGMVINYDLPKQRENYIHRIGRAGRYGKKGTAINFVLPSNEQVLHHFMTYYEANITEIPYNLDEL